MILPTPIPTIFFLGFTTRGSHNHFIGVRYTTRRPIGRSVVCCGSPLCFSTYSINPPYLCFPFLSGWYRYNKFYIRCGSYIFMIAKGVINIRAFNTTNEVCSLAFTRVRPLYITSSWFFYSQFKFSYFGCIDGIHIVLWVACVWGSSRKSWGDI